MNKSIKLLTKLLTIAAISAAVSWSSFAVAESLATSDPARVAVTRELPWDGDAEVRINVPATIRYRPDAGTNLVATGSPEALSHLRLRDGRIDFDCSGFEPGEALELVLPGRALNQFTLNGTGHLVFENINQRRLEIKLNGRGDVRGTGTAEDVNLRIAGSGDAYLGGLAIQRVRVRIAGNGDAELAPEDNADIRIAGSGRNSLFSNSRAIYRPASRARAEL